VSEFGSILGFEFLEFGRESCAARLTTGKVRNWRSSGT